jgi:hypothetical protein
MLPTGKFPIQRVAMAVVSFLLTAGLLFGGYALAQHLKAGPANYDYWRSQGVFDFKTREHAGGLVLEVKTGRIQNLRPVMERLIAQVEKGKGRAVTAINFTSAMSTVLETAYDKLSFALAEAQATGRYMLLPSAEDSVERETGVKARVEVGDRFLFVNLEKGKARLYRAIQRPTGLAIEQNMAGGGG